jgi:hypothetical protein
VKGGKREDGLPALQAAAFETYCVLSRGTRRRFQVRFGSPSDSRNVETYRAVDQGGVEPPTPRFLEGYSERNQGISDVTCYKPLRPDRPSAKPVQLWYR